METIKPIVLIHGRTKENEKQNFQTVNNLFGLDINYVIGVMESFFPNKFNEGRGLLAIVNEIELEKINKLGERLGINDHNV